MEPDLSFKIKNITFPTPVCAASGTFGYGQEFSPLLDLDRVGAVFTKGLSLEPKRGNPPPRIYETASGVLNSVGLQNIGVEKFISDKIPFLEKFKVPVIVNVAGKSEDEFVKIVERLEDCGRVDGYELNVSCPNVSQGGMAFGTDPKACERVVSSVRKITKRMVAAKLSPNVTDIRPIAKACQEAGADCITLINTVTGMAIDIKKKKPVFARTVAGLSGPAIKPVALKMVWDTVRCVNVPVIGMGGISTVEDALEFFMAGATAIQVGTANFVDPSVILKITDGLSEYLKVNNVKSLRELRIKD